MDIVSSPIAPTIFCVKLVQGGKEAMSKLETVVLHSL